MLKHTHLPALCILLAAAAYAAPGERAAAPATEPATETETIVIIRHGETASDASGQLSPRGFNRAIGLSTVLPKKYEHPAAIFAPDPYEKIREATGMENYVRPLATIEPTAIKLGLPVKTPCGLRDDASLVEEVTAPMYANATVYVAWEHVVAQKIAIDLMKKYDGDVKAVPTWEGKDFDSIYVVKITRAPGAAATISFQHDQEDLDNQSTEMPKPASTK